MRKLIYSLMSSLDGFIAGPNGELDWAIIDDELHAFINAQFRELGAELYGRRTWEVMAAYWPTADTDPTAEAYAIEFARLWQATPKVVFSTTLTSVDAPNARLVKENAVEEIRALKEQSGGDLSIAGSDLAATAIRAGLVDEYGIYVQPALLGRGTRLFPETDVFSRLSLAETRTFGSGVVYLHYRRSDADSAV